MRKLVFFLAFIVLGTVGLVAQDQDRDRDHLMLVDGDVLQIRDRDQIRLHEQITLNDGTIVNPNCTYLTKDQDKDKDQDRIRQRLKDGSCLDSDGIVYRNEYQYQYKVKQENKGLSEAQIQVRNENRYLIMAIDGEAYQVKNQSQNLLKEQLKLGNGVVVNPDGTYQRDRDRLRLKDGECINLDGQMFKNTYMQRKMVVQKNMKAKKTMTNKKVQKKPNVSVQKKSMKKTGGK